MPDPLSTQIIVATAPWCASCAGYKPQVKTFAEQHGYQYREVNIEADPAFAAKHGVQSLPTTLIMRGGVIKDRFSGAVNIGMLATRVNTLGA